MGKWLIGSYSSGHPKGEIRLGEESMTAARRALAISLIPHPRG